MFFCGGGSYPSNTNLGGNIQFRSHRGFKMTTATLLCGVALFLLAAHARAQIALVDTGGLTTASIFTNTSTSLRLAANLTVSASANTLVVVVTFRNASASTTEAPSTLNWTNATSTNTLTLAVQKGSKAAGGGRNSAIYYLYNPTAGTGFNISGKLSGQPGSSGALVAYTLGGVDTTVTTPAAGSASGTGAGAPSSLSFIVSGITANSWAAVGGDVAATSGIPISATSSGMASGTAVLTTTTGGFSSTTTAAMGYISAIIFGGSDTFTMTNTPAFDCALAAAVFSPSNLNFLAIGQQPQTVTISSGQNATFTVSANGNPAVTSYQW